MTLCPVALAAGCVKCPVVKLCPLKEIVGNYVKEEGGSPEIELEPESEPTEEEGEE